MGCGSPRLVRHTEIHNLVIAHIDCDAFYAAVEKRDNPELKDKPLIIGGRSRGVVSTACYIARIKGVRSAMPMFKALKLCPEAVVVSPDISKYAKVGQQVKDLMLATTPMVQSISIDEAFLDLNGTQKLHGSSPAVTLAKLIHRIESEIGITASVGIAPNKFLAKIASDLQKPRGFSVIGEAEKQIFLAPKSVSLIWGVGKAMQETLERDGINTIGQLQSMERNELLRRYGSMGSRLFFLSRGQDVRDVETGDETKSVSAETTFDIDISDFEDLDAILWELAEKVSRRAKAQELAGTTVSLKLKTKDFKTFSRATTLSKPTALAYRIYDAASPLLKREASGQAFRLIGVGISHLCPWEDANAENTLDLREKTLTKAEMAIDAIRNRFGKGAVTKGRGLKT